MRGENCHTDLGFPQRRRYPPTEGSREAGAMRGGAENFCHTDLASPNGAAMGGAASCRAGMENRGIKRIDKLPDGWRRCRLKNLFFYEKGLNITKADLVQNGIAVISYGQIHAKTNCGTTLDKSLLRFIPETLVPENCKSKLAWGDIVFADTSEDIVGLGNCILNDSKQTVYAGYHTLIAKARYPEYSKYLSYLFQTDAWRAQVRALANGVKVFSVTQRLLSNVEVTLPPLAEQQAIAAYLDRQCAVIDKLIETKEKQRALLSDIWKDVVFTATTQGIKGAQRGRPQRRRGAEDFCHTDLASPNGAPRIELPSGLASLGGYADVKRFDKVPDGWVVKRVKLISTSLSKGQGITKEDVVKDGDIACVRYGEIYSKYNHSFKDTYSFTNRELINPSKMIKSGDILFAATGELIEEIGKNIVYLGSKPCLAGGDIIVLTHTQNPEFLNYALNSAYAQAQKSYDKSKLKVVHISANDIGNIKVLLPPLKEQKEIVDYLDKKRVELDALSANLGEQIETLRRYRTSLIHECVTKGLR